METTSKPKLEPQIVHTSEDWLVIDKPAGWLSIPGRSEAPVLSQWLEAKFGQIWIVHRLDRETSGAILFARNAMAHKKAGLWFQKHEVKKVYHCIAQGRPMLPVLKIKSPIEGAPSLTQVEVKEKFEQAFLAQVRLHTGRRHQIRIHLSSVGYPLYGDPLYQGSKVLELSTHAQLEVNRVALHASRLELPSGEKFDIPLPEDFLFWLNALRGQK